MTPSVDNALAAIPAATTYEKSFVEFTVTLLQDVLNALVASSISQTKLFVDLVSELEKGLSAFREVRTGPHAVKAWLQSNVPETVTSVGPLSQSSADVIKNLYAVKLPSVVLLGDLPQGPPIPKQYTLPASGSSIPADMNALSGTTLIVGQIGDPAAATLKNKSNMPAADALGSVTVTLADAVTTMLANDAEVSYSELNTLVQAGFFQVKIPSGFISTKMTYSLDTRDASERVSSDVYSSSFSGGGGFSYSGRLVKAAATASYNQIRVKVATEKTTTSTEILTTVMGETHFDFRVDSFPPLASQAKP
jgi:hypothetical protein